MYAIPVAAAEGWARLATLDPIGGFATIPERPVTLIDGFGEARS